MATAAQGTYWHRGLAFLAGVGFAAVPAVGPFLALLAVFTGRIAPQRTDRWWWIAAALLGVPHLLNGEPLAGLAAASQIVAAWLIFRSAIEVRKNLVNASITVYIGTGLVVGLAITLLLGLRQFDGFNWETARTALDAITWQAHPAIFGHSMLVLAGLLAVVVPNAGLRAVALALGAVGVVLSGAREAVFAWLLIAVGLRFVGRRGSRGTNLVEWGLIVLMILVASGAFGLVGLGRSGFLTEISSTSRTSNLFRGTEVVAGDWWYPLGVSANASLVVVEGVQRTGLAVTKQWLEPWSRLQQIVTLQPGETYTLSAAWRPSGGATPGFDGWGQSPGLATASLLSTSTADGTHRATSSGDIVVLVASAIDIGDGWTRGFVSFRHAGERPLVWYVGVVPDRAPVAGGTTTFAELQLAASPSLTAYQPGLAERGVASLEASRLPIWRDALGAIAARPLLGWGPGGLPAAIADLQPNVERIRPVAAHAHSMVLDVAVKQGLIGVLGLLALVGVLMLRAVQQRDRAMVIVLAGTALVNLVDATLLSGSIIYALSAVLGWRAVGHRAYASHETGRTSASFARVGLAVGDALAAALAFAVGALVLRVAVPGGLGGIDPAAVLYATAAWPLASLWLGQYPGYGRPSWQELRASVGAAAAGGSAVLLIAAAFGEAVAIPLPLALVATTVSLVLTPLIRSLVKQVLYALRLWGRPVIVVGHQGSADALTSDLLKQPMLGLRPVSLLDTAPPPDRQAGLLAVTASGMRLDRDLSSHVIVVPGTSRSQVVDDAMENAGRHAFRTVQIVPRLGPIPTSDVLARPLGRMLSLEVRNNLAIASNRLTKRAFDLLLILLGGPVAAVLTGLVVLAIRLDSPGRAFYSQVRVGRDGRHFRVWKFRTMVVDAESQLAELLATDPNARSEWVQTQKLVNDPRVTRIGRLLRRTSLDELPQLWNVLRGEMSLVGPRPIVDDEVDKYGSDFSYFTQVRPGMTGYWQVSGRSDTSYEARVELDTYYVRNWSIWLDIDILLRTAGAVMRREGAY